MQFLAIVALAAVTSAAPQLERRDAATCGNNYYSDSQVQDAANTACQYVQDGSTAGSSSYPHRYNNYEGFQFQGLSGPFSEFPIKTNGEYNGGKFY